MRFSLTTLLVLGAACGPQQATTHYDDGVAFEEKGQLEQAIAEYRKAIELDPNLASAHNKLGELLRGQGQLDAAIVACRKAIELDPNLASAHDNLGAALSLQGRAATQAVQAKARSLSMAGGTAMTSEQARAAVRAADPELADRERKTLEASIAEHRIAIELDPSSALAHYHLGSALYHLGVALETNEQLDDAVAEYRKAIELVPIFAMARGALVIALRDQGQLDHAIAEYREAVGLDPSFGAMLPPSVFDDAIAELRQAIELDPSDADAKRSLEEALRLQRDRER